MSRADYLSYRKARNVSVLGIVLQTFMAASIAVYGGLSGNHFGLSAALLVALGIPVWLFLIVVYDQHVRERIEAIEAEQFEQSGAGASSVFQESAADLRVASKRLAMVLRVVMPAWCLIIALLLVGLGLWRFAGIDSFMERVARVSDPAASPLSKLAGWGTAIGLGVAFVGFIFARFVSGMAKQPAWAYLRAGAAYAVCAALSGLAIAIGLFVDKAGPDTGLRLLVLAFPIAMIFFGAEAGVSFLLELYRPRRAGEAPRLALDSLTLRFVAAPDRVVRSIGEALDYQLGFNVQRGWFYQLLSRSFWRLIVLTALIVWGLSAVVVLQPHQRGMVLRFGSVARADVGPGIHFKLPWPIDRVEIPTYEERGPDGKVIARGRTTTGTRVINLGTPPPGGEGPILWTNDHSVEELYTIVQASPRAGASDSRDVAIIAAELPMHFVISDVEKFDRFATPETREQLLKAVGQREAMRYLAGMALEDLLGPRRVEISESLRVEIMEAFQTMDAGVEVTFVGIEGVHPPRRVAANYEGVVKAEQRMLTRMDSARAEAIQVLTQVVGGVELADAITAALDQLDRMRRAGAKPDEIALQEAEIERLLERAGGSAAASIHDARAARWSKHMAERGRAARYAGQSVAYAAAPSIYQAGLYFDALKRAMQDARTYITSPDVVARMQLEDKDTGVDVFDPRDSADSED
ncbi:MAG: hypothetical protein KF902_11760 [Phycisphaeraceae bacterium]|nr:hypothetical protein [Phycisphaeraceae bacterium]